MIKRTLSILAGVLVGTVIIYFIEMVGHFIYPPPVHFNAEDPAAVEQLVKTAPLGALLFVILAWAAGAFGAGMITALLSPRAKTLSSLISGGILMIFGIVTLLTIPHPLWFWIAGLIVYLPAAYAGAKLITYPA